MDWKMYLIEGTELLFLGIGSYFDIKTKEIPLSLFAIFGSFGIVCNLLWRYQSIENIFLGGSVGILFFFVGWVTKEAIGFGDALGILILGIMKGWRGVLVVALNAFMLSAVYGAWKLLVRGKSLRDTLPFFPFLFLALLGEIVI